MRKSLLLIPLSLFFVSCASLKSYNSHLGNKIAPKKIIADIDYTHKKLQKLHPGLYGFVDKEVLDYKFDSLKATIIVPLTSKELFFKLSPLVAAVRQGHTRLIPPSRKYGMSKKSDIFGKESAPLTPFKFELFDNRYFLVENNSCRDDIPVGAALISLNNQDPVKIASVFRPTFTSDGFNKTYIDRRMSTGLSDFYYYQDELADSVLMTLKVKDSTWSTFVKRKYPDNPSDTARSKESRKKHNYHGYNETYDAYSKELSFPDADSSIAVLTIRDFQDGDYVEFYKNCFNQLSSLKTESLIIDIRDNHGGALFDAFELFKYLADTSFVFIDKAEVASANSLFHRSYFIEDGGSLNIMLGLFYPFNLLAIAKLVSGLEETDEGKYYLPLIESYPKKPNKDSGFKGNLYVIINGGTFSASCILSSNIKNLGKAVFVGEETGGAQNGTVAGQMALLKLPNSKLRLRCGLMQVNPVQRTGLHGRGIMPDIEIVPSLQDRIDGKDPEMKWILNDIQKSATGK